MVEKIIETYINGITEDDSIDPSDRECIFYLSPMISECFDYGLLCLLSILNEGDVGELEAIIGRIIQEMGTVGQADVEKELNRLKGQTDLFTIYGILISYIENEEKLQSQSQIDPELFNSFKSVLTPIEGEHKDKRRKYAAKYFEMVYSLMDIINGIRVIVNDDVNDDDISTDEDGDDSGDDDDSVDDDNEGVQGVQGVEDDDDDDVVSILLEGNFMVTREYSPDMIKKIMGLQNSPLDARDYDRYFYQVVPSTSDTVTVLTYEEEYKKYLNNQLALKDATIEDATTEDATIKDATIEDATIEDATIKDATILDYDSLTEGLNKWVDVVGMDVMAGIKEVFTKEVKEKNKATFRSIKGAFVQELDKVIFIGCNKINLCQLITLYVYSTIFTKTVRCGPKLSLNVVSYIVTYLYPLLEISIPHCFGPEGILSKLNITITEDEKDQLRGITSFKPLLLAYA